ncbi:hypothetical protein DER44DRAFT_869923 [Fusarium oxysporum]|nr:hypothetical protein DER44DRAFT_869923 [Fusarium oxysporum]
MARAPDFLDQSAYIRSNPSPTRHCGSQLQPLSLVSCPHCATACRGLHGIRTHTSLRRKRPARTPSPDWQRPSQRQRQLQPTLDPLPTSRSGSPPRSRSGSVTSCSSLSAYTEDPQEDPQEATQDPQHEEAILDPSETQPPLEDLPRARSGSEASYRSSSSYEGKGRPSIRASYRASNKEKSHNGLYNPLDQGDQPRTKEGSFSSYTSFSTSSSSPQEDPPLEPNQEEPTLQPNQEEPTLEQLYNQAIAPILERAPIKKLLAFSKVPIAEKRLHTRQAVIFTAAAYKAAKAFLKKPTERALLYFLLLPRLLGLGLQKGGLALTPAQKATKLLERGYLGRAARALIDPTPGKTRLRPSQPIIPKAIINTIKPLLDLVVTREDSPVIAFLRLLADIIRQGIALGADLLCASRLIGLEKPGGGVRLIAIGDLIYKVAMKAILITSYSLGGVEPAIFLLEEAILGPNNADFQQLVSIDLANAFNSVDRASIAAVVVTYTLTFYKAAAWAYNSPSLLVIEDGYTLASSKGVRQDLPKQHALLLLRGSIQLLLRHLQRQLNPIGLEDLWEEANCLIRQAIIALLARSPSDCPKEPSPDLIALLVREGGLRIPLHKELAT